MPDMRATPIVYQGQQPAAAPFPKVVYSGITSAFGNNIYGIRRVSFVAQAATTDQVIISPNGTCSNGLATPQSFVLAFGTQQAVDSYGLNILGGPAEPEPGNIFTQAVGTSSTRVVLGFKTTKGKGGRKLPWISGIEQGDGITEDPYGTYDFITPDGVVHTAPGSKDKIVNTPRVRVKLAMSGMTDISYLKFTGDPDPIYQNKGLAADIDKIKAAIESGSGTAYKSGFGIEINGVTPPTGVTLALATGTDLGIGLYDYVFTKRTSTHKESGPSAVFSITTTTGNQDVTITLPALDPTGDPLTIGYSIYRSAVGGTGTPISQCSGVTSTVDGTGKTTYQYQIPASYLLSYDPSILAVDGVPPLPIDPATGLACTFDTMTGLFMSGGSAFDATLPQTYTSGQGYTFVADHGAGTYTDTASDASIATNKRPPGDNTPEIDTLLATVDETLHSPLKSGLVNTGPSGGLLPLGRGLKINPAVVGGTDVSGIVINAGDDGNGVQVTGACPLYLLCAPVNSEYHATLNMGPGPWDGSGGGYDLGGAGAGYGFIALQVDPTLQPNLIDIRRPSVIATTDLYRLGANPGAFTPWDGTSHAPHVDVQYRGDTTIQGANFLFQAPTLGLSGLNKARAEFDGDVVFDIDNRIGGGQFQCYIDAFFNAGLTTGNILSAGITAVSLDAGTVNPGTGVQASGTSLSAAGINTPSITLTGNATMVNYGRSDHKAITAPATPAAGSTSLYSKTVAGLTSLYFKDSGGTEYNLATASSGGTVTSVALTAPAFLTIGGSPVTGSGTLALTLANETANTVFAGPTSGGAAAPTFRGLAAADLPLATTSAVGGVEVGANLQVAAGVLKAPTWSILTDGASNLIFAAGDVIDIETF